MSDLSELTVPGPTETALSAPFWRAAEAGRLILQRCGNCGQAVFYPREICPHCWSSALGWDLASGQGRLKSFSTIWKPGHPGWSPAAPYVIGLVELAEGPTMLSHILTNGHAPQVGQPLAFRPTNIGGRLLPAFEITATENGK